jgi:anti-sigma factor RsiW
MNQFENVESRPAACLVCETMLPEAIDGGLSEAEQRAFDKHVAGCVECATELAEAQRGNAWLAMLKTQTPEPPSTLLARILAETTGAQALAPTRTAVPVAAVPSFAPENANGWGLRHPAPGGSGFALRLKSLRRSMSEMFSIESARATFQPRFAMTAAMAFFSIALTLNLTGVRLTSLHAENFTPSGLQRTFADTGASISRSFQNNRVVYQLESRVSELRSDDSPNIQNPGQPTR